MAAPMAVDHTVDIDLDTDLDLDTDPDTAVVDTDLGTAVVDTVVVDIVGTAVEDSTDKLEDQVTRCCQSHNYYSSSCFLDFNSIPF
jgi:hypothetical protein